ncbi:MAG: hypothetical protein OQL19_17720 [Gammaproteobacteria bacterium]|nr:hypothetical protein [Gammaproteobacteria bacterium]
MNTFSKLILSVFLLAMPLFVFSDNTVESLSHRVENLEKELEQLKQSNIVNIRTSPMLPTPKAQASNTINKITFNLLSCKKDSESIVCNILIVNKSDDVQVILQTAIAYDELGNQYTTNFYFNKEPKRKRVIISGVPYEALITFPNVRDKPTQLAKIILKSSDSRKMQEYVYRSIAVQ